MTSAASEESSGGLSPHAVATILSLVAGASTGIGGLIVMFFGRPNERTIGLLLGFAGGVMLYVSFVDLLPDMISKIGFQAANFWMFVGAIAFHLICHFIPEPDITKWKSKDKDGKTANSKLIMTSVVVLTGICVHNVPEGMAVYMSSMKEWKLGLPLAIAIGLHNIPEGMAVAGPIYSATNSKSQAIKLTLLSGLCEPLGAIIFGYFFQDILTEYAVNCMLSAVAGMMIHICIKELIPTTLTYVDPVWTSISNLSGMVVIFISSALLHNSSHED